MTCRSRLSFDSYTTCSSIHSLCSRLPLAARGNTIIIMKGARGDLLSFLLMIGTYSMKGEFDFSDQMFTLCLIDSHVQLIVHIFDITAIKHNNISLYSQNYCYPYVTNISCYIKVFRCLLTNGRFGSIPGW